MLTLSSDLFKREIDEAKKTMKRTKLRHRQSQFEAAVRAAAPVLNSHHRGDCYRYRV